MNIKKWKDKYELKDGSWNKLSGNVVLDLLSWLYEVSIGVVRPFLARKHGICQIERLETLDYFFKSTVNAVPFDIFDILNMFCFFLFLL